MCHQIESSLGRERLVSSLLSFRSVLYTIQPRSNIRIFSQCFFIMSFVQRCYTLYMLCFFLPLYVYIPTYMIYELTKRFSVYIYTIIKCLRIDQRSRCCSLCELQHLLQQKYIDDRVVSTCQ